jgi:hypothetical protein
MSHVKRTWRIGMADVAHVTATSSAPRQNKTAKRANQTRLPRPLIASYVRRQLAGLGQMVGPLSVAAFDAIGAAASS